MKRLILLCMMFISSISYTDDTSSVPAVNQSSTQDTISVSISNIHHIDLDNTEIDSGGNWLNKRIWYERSQTIFDEIRVLVSSVTDLRIQFSNEINAVGQKIDLFFETISFSQGELDDKFKEMLVALDVKQKLVGDLTEEERTLQASIKQSLPAIDQIEKDIKSIGEVDKKIDQTFIQACKTIDECRNFETKSWDAFKTIAKELDDKKARNLYYQMNNYKQNIDQKYDYLKSTLLPYLHNVLVSKIEKNIRAIHNSVETLKTKGLDLERLMKKNQEDDIAELQKREQQAAEIAVKNAIEQEEEKAKVLAEKAAKDLEEARQKSFSNVMNMYYEKTIGKIVGFFVFGYHALLDSFGLDFLSSYSFPVATYSYHGMMSIKTYMHDLVEHVMSYFGTKNIDTKVVAPQLEEQSHEKVSVENKAEQSRVETVEKVVSSPGAQESVVQPKIASSDAITSEQIVTPASTKLPDLTEKKDEQVVVQSLRNSDHQDQKKIGIYQLFTAILDFIGTILISLYTCFIQFLKLLYSFSTYLTS